jgi:acetyl esterase/lipase
MNPPKSSAFVFISTCAFATFLGMVVGPLRAQDQSPEVVLLWPEGAAESKDVSETEQTNERGKPGSPDRAIRNVTQPSLEIFRAEKPNGAGVLIMPGGGYGSVVIDKEGREVARWFNSIGITAAVLKYRLPNTATHRFGEEVPLRDAQRALRYVRSKAADWGLQTNRIGAIGFSAGGHLASTLGTQFDDGNATATDPVDRISCRPDFLILGYAVISMDSAITHQGSRNSLLGKNPSAELVQRFSNELQVRPNTPPVFIFCAADDEAVVPENSIRFYQAARAAKVSAELHIFETGSHGFALRPGRRAGLTWPKLCEAWLQALVKKPTGKP